jgi:seryl-tRNA synthetase
MLKASPQGNQEKKEKNIMTEEHEYNSPEAIGGPRWFGIAVAALAAVSLLALGIGWSASNHAKSTEQSMNTQVKTLSQNEEILGKRLAQGEETNAQLQGELNVVTDRLKLTQGELTRARQQAKQIREDSAKQLSEMENSVKSELATKASTEDVKNLSGDVESTKQNLQMARGELGTLIARNHEEIDQLRRLGERDYYEFTIDRKGARQKVGSLTVELRDTNTKKNQFSVALYVDDMRLEKRNRSVNEPIYFYTRGSRQALEMVVNQVGKNKVTGYLSVPKSQGQASSSGN